MADSIMTEKLTRRGMRVRHIYEYNPLRQIRISKIMSLTPNKIDFKELDASSHKRRPIEPGSWSALSGAIGLDADVQAVQIHLELPIDKDRTWTWHRIFDVKSEAGRPETRSPSRQGSVTPLRRPIEATAICEICGSQYPAFLDRCPHCAPRQ